MMTLTLKTADPAGGETMSFKDIKVYGRERTAPANKIIYSNSTISKNLLKSEGKSFSSSIELEFDLSSSSGQRYPFDKFYTDRIMIVRNRFDTVQPNHYTLTKGSEHTYKLQLYLSGMPGDT
jgi:hypothetical protein